jgi:hypothetical protein
MGANGSSQRDADAKSSRLPFKKSSQAKSSQPVAPPDEASAKVKDSPSTSVQVTVESVAMNPDTDQLGGTSISVSASAEPEPVHEPLQQRRKTYDDKGKTTTVYWTKTIDPKLPYEFTPTQLDDALKNKQHAGELEEPIRNIKVYKTKDSFDFVAHAVVLVETDNRFFTIERDTNRTLVQESKDPKAILGFKRGQERLLGVCQATKDIEGTGTVAEVLQNLLAEDVIGKAYSKRTNNCQRLAGKVLKHHSTEGVRLKWPLIPTIPRVTSASATWYA